MLAGVSERGGRGRGPIRWLVAGYAGLAGFFLLEELLRQKGNSPASRPPSRTKELPAQSFWRMP